MSSRTLGIRKFDRILLASSIEMIVDILIGLIDSAVTGHVIGMAGLSAMNVIAPALGFTVFTENLFSVGTSMLYAKHTGEYQREASENLEKFILDISSNVELVTSREVKKELELWDFCKSSETHKSYYYKKEDDLNVFLVKGNITTEEYPTGIMNMFGI